MGKKIGVIPLFALLLLAFPINMLAEGNESVRIVDQTMVVFPVDETTVQIVQSMSIENTGDETEEQLSIFLPENYADLSLGDGLSKDNTTMTDKGLIETTGLPSGETKQLVVTYKMPMFDGESRWEIEQAYVTDQIQVVIQPGILSFNASNLVTQSDLFEMNGREFRRFTRLNLHPGEKWPLMFQKLKPSSQEQEQATPTIDPDAKYTEDGLKVIGGEGFGYGKASVTIILIIVAFSAALVGLKRDLLRTTGNHRKVKRTWLVDEKAMLLEEIVQLEKDYRSKLLTDSTYEKTREKIREQLVRIQMELE
ncbi:hypothetical protein [Aquibacillus salsiterrae]|uniref:Uncharacterized protein n=1 Tax=Aquibacillus salsiterrae TaxID=2950439 RepID=A0A9X3WFP0_9BACI|nr:hypothetical protein [Aquibacillus salsiterrae]MDC3418153.1 hypothetical protein [Aquibacillus salsiterrae]